MIQEKIKQSDSRKIIWLSTNYFMPIVCWLLIIDKYRQNWNFFQYIFVSGVLAIGYYYTYVENKYRGK